MSIVSRLTTDFHNIRVCLGMTIVVGRVGVGVEKWVHRCRRPLAKRLGTFEGQTLLQAFLELVENHGQDDHHAGNHLFPKLLDAQLH